MEKTFRVFTVLVSVLASLVIMGGSPVSGADTGIPWTTVGSAGTVDEGSLLSVMLGSPMPGDVRVRPGLRTGWVTIRYNVVAVEGMWTTAPSYALRARFRDRGNDEQVLLKLKRKSLASGISYTLLILDSNNYTPPIDGSGWQVQTVSNFPDCQEDEDAFDFINNAYFVDVTIKKEALNADPVLSIIQVYTLPCLFLPQQSQ